MKKKLGLSKKIIYPANSPFIYKKDINKGKNKMLNNLISKF